MLRWTGANLLFVLVLASHVVRASVVIEVGGTPSSPTTVPNVMSRIQVIDYQTGQIAYNQIVNGQVQSAILSDDNEAVYSVSEAGTPLFAPLSSLYLQKIGERRRRR